MKDKPSMKYRTIETYHDDLKVVYEDYRNWCRQNGQKPCYYNEFLWSLIKREGFKVVHMPKRELSDDEFYEYLLRKAPGSEPGTIRSRLILRSPDGSDHVLGLQRPNKGE